MIHSAVVRDTGKVANYLRLMSSNCEESLVAAAMSEVDFTPSPENGYNGPIDEDDKCIWQVNQIGRLLHVFALKVYERHHLTMSREPSAADEGTASAMHQESHFWDVLGHRTVAGNLPPDQNPILSRGVKQTLLEASSLTEGELLRLLFQLYHRHLPEPAEVVLCTEQTTAEELNVFFNLAELYQTRLFTLVSINKLPHSLQEQVTAKQLHLAAVPCARLCYIQVRI